MTISSETIIQECTDADISSIPQTKYDFITIDKIPNLEPNTMVGKYVMLTNNLNNKIYICNIF